MTPKDPDNTEVSKYFWWHSIDLGNGIVTPGVKSREVMSHEANCYFDGIDLAGKSVLDVGTWNGGFAVEAKRRGASNVLATDCYVWRDEFYNARATFDYVLRATGLNIEGREIDTADIRCNTVGKFDVVLFLGVFYHLFDPISVLKNLSDIAKDLLVVETHMDALEDPRPAMIMYPGSELSGDPSNWWGPNRACMEALLREVGFTKVVFKQGVSSSRGIFLAWK